MKVFCRVLYIAILFMALGISLAKHGEPKTGNENFFVSLFSYIISFLIVYGAGMFD